MSGGVDFTEVEQDPQVCHDTFNAVMAIICILAWVGVLVQVYQPFRP